MSTLELGALILAGEFALLAWVILFVLLRRQRKRAHADHAHAGAVIEQLENNEVSRRDALANLFETTYRLEGEELAAKVDEYVAREKAFYNAMLSLYLNRDGEKLKDIPEELAKVLTPWVQMTPTGMIHASEVSSLENEKAVLAAELNSTKNTLEQLMDEYMAAFKKNQPSAQESAAPMQPPPEPEPIPGIEAVDLGDFNMEDADFDVQSFDTSTLDSRPDAPMADPAPRSEPEPEPPPSPRSTPEPAPKPTPEPPEETLDADDIDAMLNAFASNEPPPAKPAPTQPIALTPQEIEEALARDELEGLADLFENTSETDRKSF